MKHLFYKTLLLCALAAGCCATGHADRFDRSREYLRLLQEQKGDSLGLLTSPELLAKLPAGQLAALFPQLVSQLGPLQKAGAWSGREQSGYEIDEAVLSFEHADCRVTLSYDAEGLVAGLFFAPVAKEAPAPAEKADTSSVFRERETQVVCGNVVLPATLCLPRAASGKAPLVVLVHGSGPADRDETVGPNKPFRELARELAAEGIATLRYDKRTLVYAGRLEDACERLDYDTETVDDAIAALRLARTFGGIDPGRLFVAGHSLGGALAPRIAARSDVPVAGIILLAAPARQLEESLREQTAYIARLQGGSTAQADSLFRALRGQLPEEYLEAARKYRPVKTAATLDAPILVVQGGHDYQVTRTDYELWQKGLRKHAAAAFVFVPSADHLLRSLPAMATPQDYLKTAPLCPEAVQAIAGFVNGKK